MLRVDVVLLSLLLTLTHFTPFSGVSIIHFEQVSVCWDWSLPENYQLVTV